MVVTRICGRSPTSRQESRSKIVWIVNKGERIAVELSPILVWCNFQTGAQTRLNFIFPFTSISVRNCFLSPPVPSGCNGSPDTRFFRTTTWLMSWPDWERYLFPQQCLVVTLLFSLVSTFLGLEAYCLI